MCILEISSSSDIYGSSFPNKICWWIVCERRGEHHLAHGTHDLVLEHLEQGVSRLWRREFPTVQDIHAILISRGSCCKSEKRFLLILPQLLIYKTRCFQWWIFYCSCNIRIKVNSQLTQSRSSAQDRTRYTHHQMECRSIPAHISVKANGMINTWRIVRLFSPLFRSSRSHDDVLAEFENLFLHWQSLLLVTEW